MGACRGGPLVAALDAVFEAHHAGREYSLWPAPSLVPREQREPDLLDRRLESMRRNIEVVL